MQYAMFLVMRDIRHKSAEQISKTLIARLAEEKETFESNDRFRLHRMNGRQIHHILARMTEFVEIQSGIPSRYADYIVRSGKNGYEVEHIWSNHPEQHEDEFKNPADFDDYRNRIGGLLLLPKSFNASYGDYPMKPSLSTTTLRIYWHEACTSWLIPITLAFYALLKEQIWHSRHMRSFRERSWMMTGRHCIVPSLKRFGIRTALISNNSAWCRIGKLDRKEAVPLR
jgi:hypothetical protein